MMVGYSFQVQECPRAPYTSTAGKNSVVRANPLKNFLKLLIALIVITGGVIAVVAAGFSLSWPLIHDSPIMRYIAWTIKDGAVPYRDIFDVNFPGTYLVHMLVLSIPGDIDVLWRVFDL